MKRIPEDQLNEKQRKKQKRNDQRTADEIKASNDQRTADKIKKKASNAKQWEQMDEVKRLWRAHVINTQKRNREDQPRQEFGAVTPASLDEYRDAMFEKDEEGDWQRKTLCACDCGMHSPDLTIDRIDVSILTYGGGNAQNLRQTCNTRKGNLVYQQMRAAGTVCKKSGPMDKFVQKQ